VHIRYNSICFSLSFGGFFKVEGSYFCFFVFVLKCVDKEA